jgi:two-component system, OmpR family, phosphate regulon sensor histidine kinase PhoR
MTLGDLSRLAATIRRERDVLLSRWREQVRQLPSAKHLDTPTLNDHVPALLDELAMALESVSDESIPETLLAGSPPMHGIQRFQDGFDIVEVVAEYNILRGCIHDLAESEGVGLFGKAFHILNRVFDESIGIAVQTFATQQALAVQRRREEYLAFVAHDLRTPLNAIALAGRVLEYAVSKPGDSDAARMIRTLHRNVTHLQVLVDKVLKESDHVQTATGIELQRREFDLWPLVESLIRDLHPVAETSSTQLLNEVPEDLSAYADASLLRRVFQNLAANAIRHSPRGEVVIGAREIESGRAIECWVRDNGAGIPREQLDRIFEKLTTDAEREVGSGLGLDIVKTFVEAHGGNVSVESSKGVGSTFRFTLPGRPDVSEA